MLIQAPQGQQLAREPAPAGRRRAARAARPRCPQVADVGALVRADDGRSALLPVVLDVGQATGTAAEDVADDRIETVLARTAAVAAAHPDLTVAQVGDASIDHAINGKVGDDFKRAEKLSLPITLGILLLTFGALFAAGVPVLLALSAVGTAIGLSALVSHLLPVSDTLNSVILLIGMAVGVDYSLFYVRRTREERARGASRREAIDIAAATSGRAVVVSGIAVIVAMSGLLLSGQRGVQLDGGRHDARRRRGRARLADRAARGARRCSATRSTGRASRSCTGCAAHGGRPVLAGRDAASCWPSRSCRWWSPAPRWWRWRCPRSGCGSVSPGADSLPRSIPVMKTYDAMTAAFPQTGFAHTVVVWSDDDRPLDKAAVAARAWHDWSPTPSASGQFADLGGRRGRLRTRRADGTVDLAMSGRLQQRPVQGVAGAAARRARAGAARRRAGRRGAVTGDTAGSVGLHRARCARTAAGDRLRAGGDFRGAGARVPVGGRRGHRGRAQPAVGRRGVRLAGAGLPARLRADGCSACRTSGFIVDWLPLFLFVILFGLSMDYHVFVVSRIREAHALGEPTRAAVARGVTASAGVVTSAAAVMVGVFSIFATLSLLEFKQLGVGLAAAVLIDATIVRAVLLPAAMALLGRRNWWLPGWLDRRLPAARH